MRVVDGALVQLVERPKAPAAEPAFRWGGAAAWASAWEALRCAADFAVDDEGEVAGKFVEGLDHVFTTW